MKIKDGDTMQSGEKIPFIKAKDVRNRISCLKSEESLTRKKEGDLLLRAIVTSLSKGRADDQKAVAEVAKELLDLGWYGN